MVEELARQRAEDAVLDHRDGCPAASTSIADDGIELGQTDDRT
ncbi:MAG: hypothetical protein ACOH2L_13400 [Devosia sp.]